MGKHGPRRTIFSLVFAAARRFWRRTVSKYKRRYLKAARVLLDQTHKIKIKIRSWKWARKG